GQHVEHHELAMHPMGGGLGPLEQRLGVPPTSDGGVDHDHAEVDRMRGEGEEGRADQASVVLIHEELEHPLPAEAEQREREAKVPPADPLDHLEEPFRTAPHQRLLGRELAGQEPDDGVRVRASELADHPDSSSSKEEAIAPSKRVRSVSGSWSGPTSGRGRRASRSSSSSDNWARAVTRALCTNGSSTPCGSRPRAWTTASKRRLSASERSSLSSPSGTGDGSPSGGTERSRRTRSSRAPSSPSRPRAQTAARRTSGARSVSSSRMRGAAAARPSRPSAYVAPRRGQE